MHTGKMYYIFYIYLHSTYKLNKYKYLITIYNKLLYRSATVKVVKNVST